MAGLMAGAVGGWLGPRSQMPSSEGYLSEEVTNSSGSALAVGEIVRIVTNDAVTRSQADAIANVQGTIGVVVSAFANGALGPVATVGKRPVLMQSGLAGVAAGQTIWVSPTTAGRGTNVEPAIGWRVGIIKDATNYAVDETVVADVAPDLAQDSSSGSFESLTNNSGSPTVVGEVVRISGNSQFNRAQASSYANLKGTIGVTLGVIANGAVGPILTNGQGKVLLDAGLQPNAGDTIWVSAATSGRGSTREPANFPVPIGVVKDASSYGTDSTVVADVSVIGAASGQGESPFFADWAIASPRYYALDPDAGDDDNDGFSDTSMADAGTKAMATWAALRAIIPPVGNARQIVICIKPRALGATIPEDFQWRGFGFYRSVILEGTTDFSNTATDKVLAGAVVAAAGPNGDGSWTCAGGATVATWAIAAGALPAESTIVGKRVRFKGNVTGALTNVVKEIAIVVPGGGGTITDSSDLGTAPAAGDEFFIEHAGVAFQSVLVTDGGATTSPEMASPILRGVVLKGIASTTAASDAFTVTGPARTVGVHFCEQRGTGGGVFVEGLNEIIFNRTARDESGTGIDVGTGLRTEGSHTVIECFRVQATESVWTNNTGAGATFTNIGVYTIGALGCYFAAGVTLRTCGFGPVPSFLSDTGNTFGRDPFGASTSRGARIVGPPTSAAAAGVYVSGSNGQFSGFSVENMGALPCMRFDGVGLRVRVEAATGTTGNTDVGIDLVNAIGGQFCFGDVSANTITGTAGDIRLNTPLITTHAGLTVTNIVDRLNNNISGAAGTVHVGQCELVFNASGGALAVGQVVRSNGLTGQVTSAQATTGANATGVTGVMVTPPANNTFGYRTNVGSPMVRMDAAATVGNLCYLSEATAGNGKSVPPALAATNQKLRLGYIEAVALIGGVNYAVVPWHPELIPILSDGIAP